MREAAPDSRVIFAKDLRVSYGDREILHGVTIEVQRGETVVILGGSGSGKSTLLRTLVGLEKPTSGEVRIRGIDLRHATERQMDEARRKIGLSFQGGALIGSLTVGENVALPIREHTDLPDSTIQVMVRIKLEQVGLIKFEHFMPSQLSGGMKKRAALARAMALDPEILFFDEPSAGLDPIVAAGIDHLILELKSALGVSIVVVTHELSSAFLIATGLSFSIAEAWWRLLRQMSLSEARILASVNFWIGCRIRIWTTRPTIFNFLRRVLSAVYEKRTLIENANKSGTRNCRVVHSRLRRSSVRHVARDLGRHCELWNPLSDIFQVCGRHSARHCRAL